MTTFALSRRHQTRFVHVHEKLYGYEQRFSGNATLNERGHRSVYLGAGRINAHAARNGCVRWYSSYADIYRMNISHRC
jgi:hypothetical protein